MINEVYLDSTQFYLYSIEVPYTANKKLVQESSKKLERIWKGTNEVK